MLSKYYAKTLKVSTFIPSENVKWRRIGLENVVADLKTYLV